MEKMSLFCLTVFVFVLMADGQNIVNKEELTEGEKLEVTCRVSDVSNDPNIIMFDISLKKGGDLMAAFNGRNIDETVSGTRYKYTSDVNGDYPALLRLTIDESTCSDSGLYTCFYSGRGQSPQQSQNTTVLGRMETLVLTPTPDNTRGGGYAEDTQINITCRGRVGKEENTIGWFIKCPSNFGSFEVTLPDNRYSSIEMVRDDVVQSNNGNCENYRRESDIGFKMMKSLDNCQLTCRTRMGSSGISVMDTSANITLELKADPGDNGGGGNTGQSKSSGSDDLGLILGLVFGILALIIIIVVVIYFCWYRRRGKEESYGADVSSKPSNNSNYANHPPPVVYTTDTDDKAPGMTNDALNVSIDSRDSSSHGPPRYTNDIHRGRYNPDEAPRASVDDDEPSRGRRFDSSKPRGRYNRGMDQDEPPRPRHYSTEDNTDSRAGYGDPGLGTAI